MRGFRLSMPFRLSYPHSQNLGTSLQSPIPEAHSTCMKLAALAALTFASVAVAQPYQFSLNPSSHAQVGISAGSSSTGTLIGAYDAAVNPGGTRTKPGASGSFDPTENVAVPVASNPAIFGNVNVPVSGSFQMSLNMGASVFQLSNYAISLLGADPLPMQSSAGLSFDTFRTQNPSATYEGGSVLTFPITGGAITHWTVEQVGSAQGSLTLVGPGVYQFDVVSVLRLNLGFNVQGNSFSLLGEPFPIPLSGELTLTGGVAHLTGINNVSFEELTHTGMMLPRVGLDLPPPLGSGPAAGVLLDVGDTSLTANMNSTLTMDATGVPAPGGAVIGLMGGAALMRRRRA